MDLSVRSQLLANAPSPPNTPEKPLSHGPAVRKTFTHCPRPYSQSVSVGPVRRVFFTAGVNR
jgi:hypothetical protein